ncbi:10620_t:CDS:2 [Ambispora leptoticha]|uniref:10620_t:CDS:1 n=1 Tax=Ambispora leptoticha TaxID=144679 RepID=A0A9N8VLG6_9GLOM|nr:10620_t:CDS:2 [Ambispora leptoticha]
MVHATSSATTISQANIMAAKKETEKKSVRNSVGTSVVQQQQNTQQISATPASALQPSSFTGQSSLSISRNKHWKYISSYHGPWLQLPLELLDSLYVINTDNVATPPPPIDPIIFGNLISIRRLVDEAADLSVRAASGISTSGGSMRNTMSHTRQHRMRELAVNKLALAYRIDEIATAVVTMQSASAIDEVASRVLKKNSTNLEALYVNFFHEKIPSSRMLSQSTSTEVLDQIIAASPNTPEYYRTRGVVKCFKEEFAGALRDFKTALAHIKHKKRVNSVLMGKKITSPLHHHHGKDSDECTGTESQLYFLRAACYLQYAISMVDKAIQKVDGAERKDADGKGIYNGKKDGASIQTQIPKIEQYRQELLPIMPQMQTMARRSIRDYNHFLSFYPSSLPPFTVTNDETSSSKASSPTISRDSSPNRGIHFSTHTTNENDNGVNGSQLIDPSTKNENGSSAVNGGLEPPHSYATYHPLLIEAWYAIALNYILLGDIHTAALWHARISELHECIEGYPVFLPARSMAQADYMEVLERIKKATNLVQHENLKELIDDLGTVNGRNGGNNSIGPVIGIDGHKHHPCCPLAPGNHNLPVNKDALAISTSSSPSSNSVSPASSLNITTTSNSGITTIATAAAAGSKNYPLHTARSESCLIFLRAIVLRQDKDMAISNIGSSSGKFGRKVVINSN